MGTPLFWKAIKTCYNFYSTILHYKLPAYVDPKLNLIVLENSKEKYFPFFIWLLATFILLIFVVVILIEVLILRVLVVPVALLVRYAFLLVIATVLACFVVIILPALHVLGIQYYNNIIKFERRLAQILCKTQETTSQSARHLLTIGRYLTHVFVQH